MVQLIVGAKGKGKTKELLSRAEQAIKSANGTVVYIDKSSQHMYELSNKIRLINIEDAKVASYDDMFGFIAGIMNSDYDCTDIFVDGILRIVGRDYDQLGKMFDRIAQISDNVNITFTISAEVADLPESIKKYL